MSVPPNAGAAQNGVLIDRVLAVVEGQVLTLSDARAALTFELVPVGASEDPIRDALQRLIERRLILAEVDRYALPDPPESAVDAGMAAVQARFEDALAFEIALNRSSMSRDEMRRHVRDSLRIEAYLRQRFSSSAQPSDGELAEYYEKHASEFAVNGAVPPLSAVREQVRARLIEDRRAEAIRIWIADLRRRGSVLELPRVSR